MEGEEDVERVVDEADITKEDGAKVVMVVDMDRGMEVVMAKDMEVMEVTEVAMTIQAMEITAHPVMTIPAGDREDMEVMEVVDTDSSRVMVVKPEGEEVEDITHTVDKQ